MKKVLLVSFAALALAGTALAEPPKAGLKPVDKQAPKPVDKPKPEAPEADEPQKPQGATCTLLTPEAPRGGRLEVQGQKLGKSPVVKIGGEVTRIIERPGDKIAVQIPRKSDGGEVTVKVDGKDIACGTLTIIGLD